MMSNRSQRDEGYNGGIQAGTTAYDEQSKKMDKLLKECADELIPNTSGFRSIKQFSNQMKVDLVGENCFGFAPDGGSWFIGDRLVAVFEGKKQNLLGNANERWFKNASVAKSINPDVKYITFCSGAGAKKGECLEKMSRLAKYTMGENFKFHMSPDGFTKEQVSRIMLDVLDSCK
jgi:hypothetical protein